MSLISWISHFVLLFSNSHFFFFTVNLFHISFLLILFCLSPLPLITPNHWHFSVEKVFYLNKHKRNESIQLNTWLRSFSRESVFQGLHNYRKNAPCFDFCDLTCLANAILPLTKNPQTVLYILITSIFWHDSMCDGKQIQLKMQETKVPQSKSE